VICSGSGEGTIGSPRLKSQSLIEARGLVSNCVSAIIIGRPYEAAFRLQYKLEVNGNIPIDHNQDGPDTPAHFGLVRVEIEQ
jgi:hypothetical protein